MKRLCLCFRFVELAILAILPRWAWKVAAPGGLVKKCHGEHVPSKTNQNSPVSLNVRQWVLGIQVIWFQSLDDFDRLVTFERECVGVHGG